METIPIIVMVEYDREMAAWVATARIWFDGTSYTCGAIKDTMAEAVAQAALDVAQRL